LRVLAAVIVDTMPFVGEVIAAERAADDANGLTTESAIWSPQVSSMTVPAVTYGGTAIGYS
jgi:hypothetical protein